MVVCSRTVVNGLRMHCSTEYGIIKLIRCPSTCCFHFSLGAVSNSSLGHREFAWSHQAHIYRQTAACKIRLPIAARHDRHSASDQTNSALPPYCPRLPRSLRTVVTFTFPTTVPPHSRFAVPKCDFGHERRGRQCERESLGCAGRRGIGHSRNPAAHLVAASFHKRPCRCCCCCRRQGVRGS